MKAKKVMEVLFSKLQEVDKNPHLTKQQYDAKKEILMDLVEIFELENQKEAKIVQETEHDFQELKTKVLRMLEVR